MGGDSPQVGVSVVVRVIRLISFIAYGGLYRGFPHFGQKECAKRRIFVFR